MLNRRKFFNLLATLGAALSAAIVPPFQAKADAGLKIDVRGVNGWHFAGVTTTLVERGARRLNVSFQYSGWDAWRALEPEFQKALLFSSGQDICLVSFRECGLPNIESAAAFQAMLDADGMLLVPNREAVEAALQAEWNSLYRGPRPRTPRSVLHARAETIWQRGERK